ncbi:hypothetical protein HPB50_012896 [Hyalomma asiaticum]|uniref:Uncharacterized protein n=1 Tax=Hyalomma asiaticum TaxID=266040 RepID=A0ACB7SPS8_HYAAI|nr:hypothetical protein HPB50_012896 [Hyalomma asiaticum]
MTLSDSNLLEMHDRIPYRLSFHDTKDSGMQVGKFCCRGSSHVGNPELDFDSTDRDDNRIRRASGKDRSIGKDTCPWRTPSTRLDIVAAATNDNVGMALR